MDFNQFGFKAPYNSLYPVCKLYGLGEFSLLLFQPLLCRTLSTTRHLGVLLPVAQVDTSPLPLPCSVPCSDVAAPASYPPKASLQRGDTSCQLGWLSRCSGSPLHGQRDNMRKTSRANKQQKSWCVSCVGREAASCLRSSSGTSQPKPERWVMSTPENLAGERAAAQAQRYHT